MCKSETGTHCNPFTKMKSKKWIINLDVKWKTIRHLEENIEESLKNLGEC